MLAQLKSLASHNLFLFLCVFGAGGVAKGVLDFLDIFEPATAAKIQVGVVFLAIFIAGTVRSMRELKENEDAAAARAKTDESKVTAASGRKTPMRSRRPRREE
ncbi:unnamed protein product [Pedinophyceae sp. YPF-701]|nr:unnamed protein product [Pedinophyceae sp. YPF-701]